MPRYTTELNITTGEEHIIPCPAGFFRNWESARDYVLENAIERLEAARHEATKAEVRVAAIRAMVSPEKADSNG